MATEKKLKDPTEAALSAIEQALNLDDPIPSDSAERKAEIHRLIPPEPARPAVDAHDFTAGPFQGLIEGDEESHPRPIDLSERPPASPAFLAPDRAAVANDDRQSVGMMLHALQIRPSRSA